MTENDRLDRYRKRSAEYADAAAGWVNAEMSRVLIEDGRTPTFDLIVASEAEDLTEATDYRARLTTDVAVAFRGRDPDRCLVQGHPVRQMTIRRAGQPPNREYDKILAGFGDYFVTVWCPLSDLGNREFAAGIIVDLDAFRAIPPVIRARMEEDNISNVPFTGYDAAALIAHGVVRAVAPDAAYFAAYTAARAQAAEDQERLWGDAV
jgi:hypothetical protein